MYADSEILEAARALRPELPRLFGAGSSTIDARLAVLIASVENGEVPARAIFDELIAHDATRDWLRERLQSARPRRTLGFAAGYSPLPGHGQPIPADEFVCPEPDCRKSWVRMQLGEPIPSCPVHKKPFVRKPV